MRLSRFEGMDVNKMRKKGMIDQRLENKIYNIEETKKKTKRERRGILKFLPDSMTGQMWGCG